AHGVTMRGVLSPFVVPGAGIYLNFKIYLLWHFGLPVASLAYVWLREKDRAKVRPHSPGGVFAVFAGAGVLSLACYVICFIQLPALPPAKGQWLTASTMLICASALLALWFRRRSAIDQWLMVVMLSMTVELTLSALLGFSRPHSVTVGFYGGRFFAVVT